MLTLGSVIPPITARSHDGRAVHAWDWKQKRGLAIAFLHAECAACEAWLGRVVEAAAALREAEGVALILLAENVPQRLVQYARAEVVLAADVAGHSQRAYLGEDAFGTAGLARLGVFVTDRYGELRGQWATSSAQHQLPDPAEILSTMNHALIACQE